MTKLVSVVILNWNGVQYLRKFLPLVVERTPEALAEIVVADNGSSDESMEFLQKNFPNVKRIVLDKNYGFTGGYNRALSQIGTKYYVLLNSDIEVNERWLEPLLNIVDANPMVAAVMPKIISAADKTHFEYAGAAGGFIDLLGYPFCRGRILSQVESDEGQYNKSREVFWASGACMLIDAELYHNHGGLDEDFFAHMEEIDLCWRLKNSGYKIMVEPASVVFHVGGGTLPNESPRKLYLNFRNNLFMLYKNLPKRKLKAVLLMRLILDGAAAGSYLIKGEGRKFAAVWKAHVDFHKNRRKFKAKRELTVIGEDDVSCIYTKSILLDFFCGHKHFDQLKGKDFSV